MAHQQQHQHQVDDHVQRAVEQACAQFHADPSARAHAEGVLLEFRQRAPPNVCRAVLERSTVAEARFHAACALRESVLREWAALPPGEAAAARMYALDCALALAPAQGAEAAVRSTLLGAVAVLLKRGWCDGDKAAVASGGGDSTADEQQQLMQEHAAFFGELERRSARAAQGSAGPAAVRVGLEALEAVVGEFSMGGGGGGGAGGAAGGGAAGGSASSALGMARERHARCRDELERHFLPAFFTHARRIAREACASGAALRGQDGGSCRAAMRLMTAVLSWDFRHHGDQQQQGQHGGGGAGAATATATAANGAHSIAPMSCEPGAQWAPLLLDPSTTDWLLALLGELRRLSQGGATDKQQQQLEDTRAAARQLLVALASLSGPGLFPKPIGGANARAHASPPCGPAALAHLTTVLRGVLPMVHPADAALQAAIAGSGEDELLDACRALAALCANHRAVALAAASDELVRASSGGGAGGGGGGGSVPPPLSPGLFPALEALLRSSLEAGGVSHASASEAWLPDVVEMVLESFGSALAPLLFFEAAGGASSSPQSSPCPDVPPIVVDTATRAFAALADAALADAAAGAHEDEDADEEHGAGAALQEEWFARVAALARADPAASFSHLAALIERLHAALMAVAAGGQHQQDPSELLEQLVWAVRMAAHALADSGAGESPLPPDPVLRAASSDGGAVAVLRLSRALLSVAAMPLQDAARPVCSARLVETAVAGAARWADTYLVGGGGEEDDGDGAPALPPALEHAFGLGGGGGGGVNGGINGSDGGTSNTNGNGAEVLDALSRLAVACLAGGYSGEGALHMAVCRVLLPSLVRRRRACAVLVGRPLDGWRQLCAAFAARDALLAVQLPQKAQRFLAQSLCEAAAGLADPQQQAAYVTQLIGPAASELAALAAASQQELATPAAALRACCLLETLRGCALGTLPSTHGAVYAQLSALLPSLLSLHAAFKRRPDVVALLLKLADALVETQVDALSSAQQREALLAWSLALLRQYQESQLWQSSLQQAAAALREEQLHEQCRDLRAVLSLLTHVTQRGGGGGGGEEGGGDGGDGNGNNSGVAAQVALAGLHIVLPLISVELLRLPKLAGLYYALLCDLLDAHAATVASLSPPHFASLMVSLEWGLGGGGGGGQPGAAGGGQATTRSISNPAVLRCCLEGVAGLGRFAAGLGPSAARFQQQSPGPASTRAAAQQAAAAALAPHAQQQGSGGGAAVADASSSSVVAHFQRVLLTRLLLEDASHDTVELAADALLPLLVAEPAAFAHLRDGIVQAAAAAVERTGAGAAGGGGGSGRGGGVGVVAVAADEGARRAAVGAVSKAMDALLAWLAADQQRRQLELEQEQREAAVQGGGGLVGGGAGAAAAARMRAVAAERGAQRDFRQLLCSTVANVRGFVGIR